MTIWVEMTAREKELAVLALPGLALTEIARHYGCAHSSVRSVLERLGRHDHVSRDSLYAKRDRRDEAILELLGQGFGKRESARRLGLTTGSVSGAVARMRARGLLPPPEPKAPKAFAMTPRASRASAHSYDSRGAIRGGFVSQMRITQLSQPLVSQGAAFDPLPGTTPVPYGSPGCKWPVDGLQGKGLLWCGEPRDTSKRDHEPFCAAHCRIAYQPDKPRAVNSRAPLMYIRPGRAA